MNIDTIALRNSVTKDEARHILSHDPFRPLSRSTIDQMIASNKIEEPKRKGRFKVWSKKYIADYAEMDIEHINNILKAVENTKAD